jgi:hypothetical protein
MLGVLSAFDFLNSREKAIVIWAVILVGFAAYKSDGLASSLGALLRGLFVTKLVFLFGTAAAYCGALVLAANKLGLWHTSAIKATIYWFFGTGVVLVGSAVTGCDHPDFVTKLVRRAVRFTLIVEFLVGFYVFPLAVELLIVPFILLFVGMQVVAENDATLGPAKRAIDAVLITFGFGLMLWAAVKAATNPHALLTRENAEDFLLVPALTVAFVPYLQLVAWHSHRELENLHKRWRAADV